MSAVAAPEPPGIDASTYLPNLRYKLQPDSPNAHPDQQLRDPLVTLAGDSLGASMSRSMTRPGVLAEGDPETPTFDETCRWALRCAGHGRPTHTSPYTEADLKNGYWKGTQLFGIPWL